MIRSVIWRTWALIGLVVCVTSPAGAAELIVGVDPQLSARAATSLLRGAGAEVDRAEAVAPAAAGPGVLVIDVTGSERADLMRRLQQNDAVRYVEPNHRVRILGTPNDSRFGEQWGLAKIGAPAAWERSVGTGIKVAVVDTGVDHAHPELQGRVILGRDFVSDDDDPMDVQGHGTHVAGIIAAATDNGIGVAGVAPGAQILAVRVLGDDGSGDYADVINGIVYAVDNGAKVVNLSLGGDQTSNAMRDALRYATARGVLVTCATGNESNSQVSYPARYDDCLAVGATDSADQRASFSNYGEGIDVVAPGAQVLSTVMGPGYEAWDGTSMAAPFVAGAAAQLLAQGLDASHARAAIETTAVDLADAGYDVTTGHGRLDVAAATQAAAEGRVQAGDMEPPTITGIALGKRTTKRSSVRKVTWRTVRRTRWRIVGDSPSWGAFAWDEVTTKGLRQTIVQYRLNDGLIRARTIVKRRIVRRQIRLVHKRSMSVNVTDNVGVRKVSVSINGRPVGADADGRDGFAVPIACRSATVPVSVTAIDTSGRSTLYESRLRISC